MATPPRHLLRLPDTSPTARLVLVALYLGADDEAFAAHLRGEGPPPFVAAVGWAELAEAVGLREDGRGGRSAILDALKVLRERGAIRPAFGVGPAGERLEGWELAPGAPAAAVQDRPPIRTESGNPDAVRRSGCRPEFRTPSADPDLPQVPPTPPSYPLSQEREDTSAHARDDMTDGTEETLDAPQGSGPVLRLRSSAISGDLAPPSPANHEASASPPEASPGLVSGIAQVFNLRPPEPKPPTRRGRVGRQAAILVDPEVEHPGVAAGLDAIHEARRLAGLNPRTPRPRATPADVRAMENVLVNLDIRDQDGKLDWSAWVTVPRRMFEAIRREAGSDDPKRLRAVKTAEYLHLEHLTRPGNSSTGHYANFRRYWLRDELDRKLDFEVAAAPAAPRRAPRLAPTRGVVEYEPGQFETTAAPAPARSPPASRPRARPAVEDE